MEKIDEYRLLCTDMLVLCSNYFRKS